MPGLFEQARQAEQKGNRDGRDLWDRYGAHREKLASLIVAHAPSTPGRLALLGAGNGNDLDLERLAAHFSEIHLVDIDPAALSRAVNRQSAGVRAKLRCHAPVDLTGLYRQLDARRRTTPDQLVETGVAQTLAQLPSDLDVVTSGCMLSQMSWGLRRLFEDDPEELALLDHAMANIHLRVVLGMTRPGGTGLVVADLISSEIYPLDELPADADLGALVRELADNRSAYASSNPTLLKQVLRRDAKLASLCAAPEVGEAWLWTGSRERTFLVYPLVLRRV
jgi:hypothetical protein